MIKKKKILYNIFLFLFASTLIILQIYSRLFQPKESYTLEALKTEITNYKLISFFVFCLFQILIIIMTCFVLYKKYYNIQTTSTIIQKVHLIINKIYWEPLEHLHDIIAPILPGSARFFIFIIEFIEKKNKEFRTKFYYNSYIIFVYIPLLIPAFVFFFEIVYLNKLKYFFFCLMFLLLPLLFNIYLKLCISFYDRNADEFIKILEIKEIRNIDEKKSTWDFSFKPSYSQNSQTLLQETSKDYLLLYYVKYHAENIKELKNKYYAQILIFISFIYLIAGLYRLCYLFI